MSNISKNNLKVQSGNTYVDNSAGLITPTNVRNFNVDLIDSLATQDDMSALTASFVQASTTLTQVSSSVAILNNIEFVSASQTSSMVVASASYTEYALTASYALNGGSGGGAVDTSSLLDTASFGAYTASVSNRATTGSNTFNDDNTFARNLTVLGTASINYLEANVVSQSIIFASGSNILGDSLLDVQQLTGSVGVFGTFRVDGKVNLSGSFIGELNGTASQAVSSSYALSASNADTASYVNLENDTLTLQNKTGILKGGVITKFSNNTINISAGTGQIISQSYEGPNYIKTSKNVVQWAAETNVALNNLLTAEATFIYIDKNGDLYQQTASFNNDDLRDKIVLGSITHGDNTYISAIENDQITAYNSYKDSEIANIYGVSKIRGLQMLPIDGVLSLSINSGSIYHNGANFKNDPWNANTKNIESVPTASFIRVYQTGSTYNFDVNPSLFGPNFYNNLDSDKYVNLNTGNLVTASNGYFTTQRIYQAPDNPSVLYAYYGTQQYQFVDEAVKSIAFEKFEESEATKYNTTFLGYAVVKQGAPSLVDPTNGVIIYSGINRSIFLSTGTNIGAISTPLTAITFTYNTPAVTWSLAHNLQVDFPSLTAYNSESREVVIPNTIKSNDVNNVEMHFSYPFAGYVTVMAAGAQIAQGDIVATPGALSTSSFNAWTGSANSQFRGTSSFAVLASQANSATSASFASSALSSNVSQRAVSASYISGSTGVLQNLTVLGTLSASVFYTVSSSVAFTTGSNTFGTSVTDRQIFTSSVSITGSLTLDNDTRALIPNMTGSLEGSSSFAIRAGSASFAASASQALTSSYSFLAEQSNTASFSHTASFVNNARTASLLAGTASHAFTASFIENAETSSLSVTASFALTASFVRNALTASLLTNTASQALTSSFSHTASISNTASFVRTLNQAVTVTGSLEVNTTAGTELQVSSTGVRLGNQTTDNHLITGSLGVFTTSGNEFLVTNTGVRVGNQQADNHLVTGSFGITGSLRVVGGGITGSLLGTATTASFALTASYARFADVTYDEFILPNASGITTTPRDLVNFSLTPGHWRITMCIRNIVSGVTTAGRVSLRGVDGIDLPRSNFMPQYGMNNTQITSTFTYYTSVTTTRAIQLLASTDGGQMTIISDGNGFSRMAIERLRAS